LYISSEDLPGSCQLLSGLRPILRVLTRRKCLRHRGGSCMPRAWRLTSPRSDPIFGGCDSAAIMSAAIHPRSIYIHRVSPRWLATPDRASLFLCQTFPWSEACFDLSLCCPGWRQPLAAITGVYRIAYTAQARFSTSGTSGRRPLRSRCRKPRSSTFGCAGQG
jgi:hypothetical protein